MIRFFVLMFVFTTFISGCKSSDVDPSDGPYTPLVKVNKNAGEISVMTFNIENAFDTVHNEGVEDYTYLPASQKNTPEIKAFCSGMSNSSYKNECLNKNWDQPIFNFKLSQVAKVIRYVDNGAGPDNLMIVEIENQNVLNTLVQKHLAGLGYQTISLLQGPDPRGINTAFISKFPMVGQPKLRVIPYQDPDPKQLAYARRSRGILETTVKINKKDVTFLVAHFPSQSNPSEWRRQAMEFMKSLMLGYQSNGRTVIAGGDLNVTEEEEKDYGYAGKILAQAGPVSHLVGCKHCEGTHNYKGGWSFLDILAYGNLAAAGLQLIPDSIEVVKSTVHTKRNGTPLRFDEEAGEGVSDHFPLYSRLKLL